MAKNNSCGCNNYRTINKVGCGCDTDYTAIPTLKEDQYPECPPPKGMVYMYRREDNKFYYYDHFKKEYVLQAEVADLTNLTLKIQGAVKTVYNAKTEKEFDVTRDELNVYSKEEIDLIIQEFNVEVIDTLDSTDSKAALSANMGRELKELIDNLSFDAFVGYQGNIISTSQYILNKNQNLMYRGSFTSDIILEEIESAPAFGTLFMLLLNVHSSSHTITLSDASNYIYLPGSTSKITLAPNESVLISIKGYGSARVVTATKSTSIQYITEQEVLNILNTALANYYTKTQVYNKTETYNKTEIDLKFLNIDTTIFIPVDVLPSTGQEHKIYLVPSGGSETGNSLDEYIWIDNDWEKVGQMTLDLSGYYTKTEIDSKFGNYFTKTEITTNHYTKAETDTKLSGYYTKLQSDALYAEKSHTHAALILQVAGITKGTYNGATGITFNVTAADLGVYTKTEINTMLLNYNKSTYSGNQYTGGTFTYNLANNTFILIVLECIGANSVVTLADPSGDYSGCEVLFYIINNINGGNDLTVNFPVNYGNMMYMGNIKSVVVPGGCALEVGIVSFGTRRTLTYATMNFKDDNY